MCFLKGKRLGELGYVGAALISPPPPPPTNAPQLPISPTPQFWYQRTHMTTLDTTHSQLDNRYAKKMSRSEGKDAEAVVADMWQGQGAELYGEQTRRSMAIVDEEQACSCARSCACSCDCSCVHTCAWLRM